jgi:hypothetical protein
MRENSRWLLAALLGPISMVFVISALFAIFHGQPGQRIDAFITFMMIGGVLAFFQSTSLIVVDLALAGIRLRRLPVGMRSVGSGAMAFVLMILVAILIPLPPTHPYLALFMATTIAAVPVRFLFGPRWRSV